jgi:hypothetical protein
MERICNNLITAQFSYGVIANYSILKPYIAEEFNFSESVFGTLTINV